MLSTTLFLNRGFSASDVLFILKKNIKWLNIYYIYIFIIKSLKWSFNKSILNTQLYSHIKILCKLLKTKISE